MSYPYPPGPPAPGQPPMQPPAPYPPGTAGPYGQPPAQHGVDRMAKPGAVTGVQVILGFLGVLSISGVLVSSALLGYGGAVGVGILVSGYFAVHACVCAVQIPKGKDWAWVWTLVNAIIGIVLALIGVIMGIVNIEYGGAGSIVSGVIVGGLYGTLMGLLLVESTRTWIRLHRKRPGAPDPVIVEPERPPSKPGSVGFMQFILAALILPAPLVTYSIFDDVRYEAADRGETVSQYLERYEEVIGVFILGVVLTLAVLIVHTAIAVGLGKGRVGFRVFGAIWIGTMIAAMGYQAVIALVPWLDDPDDVSNQALVFGAAGVAALGFVLALIGFVVIFMPGVRAWTPFSEIALDGQQHGSAPAGPPPGYGQPMPGGQMPGPAPQGYAPQQQAYPPPPGHGRQPPPPRY